MIVVNSRLLDIYGIAHASARKSLATWKRAALESSWKNKQDILVSFPNAKVLKRARFEIQHNKYRLIAEIFYEDGIVEVRFIDTHSEYDKMDTLTI